MTRLLALTALLGTTVLSSIPTPVAADISANVALVSDYRFRGISQSNEELAIQGGFDYAFDSGFYLGTWASSVDFDSAVDFNGSVEVDFYAGWGTDIGENSTIDLGYIYYYYPGDDNGIEGNYQEIYFNYGWKDLTLGVAYSDDYYGSSQEFFYAQANYDWGFAEDWSLSLHAGWNQFEEDIFLSSTKGDYIDYLVGVTWTVVGVDLGLAWVGTDLNKADIFDTGWGDDTAVFSIAKSF